MKFVVVTLAAACLSLAALSTQAGPPTPIKPDTLEDLQAEVRVAFDEMLAALNAEVKVMKINASCMVEKRDYRVECVNEERDQQVAKQRRNAATQAYNDAVTVAERAERKVERDEARAAEAALTAASAAKPVEPPANRPVAHRGKGK